MTCLCVHSYISVPVQYFCYVRDQRKRCHSIRERAETDQNVMSIIVDGMYQNSTQLPQTTCKWLKKTDSNLWHFRTPIHVTGAIK